MSPGATNKESGVLPCVNRYFLFFVSSVGSHLERALCNYSSIYCEALSKKKKKKVYPKVNLRKVFPWKWVVTSTTLAVVEFSDTFQGFWNF